MLRDLWSQLRGGRMQMSGEVPVLRNEPINPAWVLDGSPEARAAVLTESSDGRMRSGGTTRPCRSSRARCTSKRRGA